jgi:signal transduction histidine kinase
MKKRGAHDWAKIFSLMAHELRSPLSVVIGYVRMLLNEQLGPLSDRQKKVLDEAVKSSGRLSHVIAEMSDLARLESGDVQLHLAPVNLSSLVAEAAQQVQGTDDRRPPVSLFGETDSVVNGDAARLRAAFAAFLTASLREAASTSAVEVHWSMRGRKEAVVAIAPSQSALELRHSDIRSLVPYSGFVEGVGLGVVVAAKVVELHGGRTLTPPGHSHKGTVVVLPTMQRMTRDASRDKNVIPRRRAVHTASRNVPKKLERRRRR